MDRFFLSDNGSLQDMSTALDNYHGDSQTISYVAAEDKIYIGSVFPFNSKYFKVSSANVSSADISIKYWDGNQFRSMVEIIDETAASGVSMAGSGHITWVPDKDYAWTREDTEDIPELSSIKVYDLFWLEISFSADCAFDLQWLGHLFSNDDDLGSEYPDLIRSNVKIAFESGKTDWEEQAVRAGSLIMDDMIARRIIHHGNQILDRRILRTVSVSKTAELIFSALGDDYIDQRDRAHDDYKTRLRQDIFNVDTNNNAKLELGEQYVRQGRLYR